MTLVIQDSFTDTNGTALSSHTSESGATYARHGSFTVATITIEDNRAAKDTDAATAVYYVNNITDPKFFEIEFTIIDKSDVNRSTGIEAGIDTGSDTAIIYRRQNATTWQLLTIIAGTPSATLLSASETFSAEAQHTLKLRRIPETNDYECFVDNVSLGVVTISDAEFLGAGKIGFRATNSQGAGVGYHLDNLSVQSLSAPRALHRGRNFPLFDDEEVNRFEFWPPLAAVSELLLTPADDISNLSDVLTLVVEHRISLADDTNTLADSTVLVLGIESALSDTLEALTDAQSQLLGQLSALSDSLTADWGDAFDLALAHLLTFSDDTFSLNDAALLNLEQREQFSDSLVLNDAVDLILTHQLTFTDSSYGLPATPLLDNFNRADEDPATGWTQVFTSASNIHIFNNQVSGHSIDLAYGIFTALTPGDEQEAYVSISTGQVSGGGSGNQAYLLLRFTGETSDAATGYLVNAFSTFIRVYRVDGLASFDLLTTQDIGIALTAGDKLGARMRGDLLEVWTNIQNAGWNRVDTVIDSTYPSGKIGVGIRTLDNTLLLDDFGGGTVTGGLTDSFAHQLAISDTGVLNLPLSDSLNSLDDSLLLGYGLVLAEDVANLTDSQTGELSYLVALDDSVTFEDSVALTGGYLVTFNDSFALIDAYLVSLEHRQSFNDSITLTDAEANQLGQLSEFTDAVGLSDDIELLLAHYPLFADAIVISDSVALLMTHFLSLDDDVNLLIDSLQTDTPQGPEILVGVTDALILTDALQVQLHQLLTLSDNAANWADFLAKTVGIGLILNDNAANLIDDYAALLTHGLAVFDALTLTDSLTTFGENYLQVADSLALADEVDVDLRGPDVNLDLDDSLTLSDAVSVETRVELQYQLVLSDAIVLYDHYFDLRHPYTPSTKRHIVVPSRARTTRVPAREKETVPTGNRTTKVP